MYVHSSDPFPTFGPVALDPGSRYSTKLIKQYSVEFMTALLQLPSPFPLAAKFSAHHFFYLNFNVIKD